MVTSSRPVVLVVRRLSQKSTAKRHWHSKPRVPVEGRPRDSQCLADVVCSFLASTTRASSVVTFGRPPLRPGAWTAARAVLAGSWIKRRADCAAERLGANQHRAPSYLGFRCVLIATTAAPSYLALEATGLNLRASVALVNRAVLPRAYSWKANICDGTYIWRLSWSPGRALPGRGWLSDWAGYQRSA